MRFALLTASAAIFLASCAQQQRGPQIRGPVQFAKNPSVILALDIAQNRRAQEVGVYKALEETSADNALTFAPEPVNAREWLKAAPPIPATSWAPHKVFMSCDGKTGVTTGAIKWGEVDGYYTTVWQYYEKSGGRGEWRWILSHGDGVDTPREAPDFLQTKVASCKGRPTAQVAAPPVGEQMKQGFSRDQSLSWTWRYRPNKSRYLVVNIWDGERWEKAFADNVKAP